MNSYPIREKLLSLNILTGNFIFAAPKTKENHDRQVLMEEIIAYVEGLEAQVEDQKSSYKQLEDAFLNYREGVQTMAKKL